jgi:phage tail tape-measure protein
MNNQENMKVTVSANIAPYQTAMARAGAITASVGRSANTAFAGVGSAGQSAAGAVSRTFSNMSASVGRSMQYVASQTTQALKVMTGALTLGAGTVATFGVKFNSTMEQSGIAWETLMGSVEGGQKMLNDLKDMAKFTPFEFEELDQSAKQLKAMGFEADEIIPLMTTLGNAVSAVGGNSEQLRGIATAIGQIRTKGKISAEEIIDLSRSSVRAA